jgi:hypothetical protein
MASVKQHTYQTYYGYGNLPVQPHGPFKFFEQGEGPYVPMPYQSPDPERMLGVEVEVERLYNGTKAIPFWVVKEDGSLREEGKEYITFPSDSQKTYNALTYLFGHLKQLNPSYNFSPRTSIHVHVNIRDMSFSEVASVVLLYLTVEGLFYKFVGRDRDKSVFCVPIQSSTLPHTFLQDINVAPIVNTARVSKYMGLNLLASDGLGTLEFRHMPGTDDVDKINLWITLILHLFRVAQQKPFDELLHQVLGLTTTSDFMEFMVMLFKEHHMYLPQKDLSTHLQNGCRFVKTVCGQAGTYHQQLRNTINPASPLLRAIGAQEPVIAPIWVQEAGLILRDFEEGRPEPEEMEDDWDPITDEEEA